MITPTQALSYGKTGKNDINVHTSTILSQSTKITGHTYKVKGTGLLRLQAADRDDWSTDSNTKEVI